MDVREMTAPCGIACWACAIYKDNITDEVTKEVSAMTGLEPSDIPCDGCRSEGGCSVESALSCGKGCLTKRCVADKGLHNCSECDEFPCDNLMPVAELSDKLPHNTKIYNLSRIKLIGIEAWAKEAALIQRKYFTGNFVYGQAPSLKD